MSKDANNSVAHWDMIGTINSGAHWDNVTSEPCPIVPEDIVLMCPHLLLKK